MVVLDQQVILNNDGTFYINGNRLGDGTITNTIYNTTGQLEKRIKALEDKINNNNSNKKYKIVMGEQLITIFGLIKIIYLKEKVFSI